MISPARVLAGAVALAIAAAAPRARADAASDDALVTARLAWLEGVLNREEASTRLWRSSWLGIYAAVTLVEGSLLATATTPADRINAAIGGGKSAVGFTFVLVSPSTGSTVGATLRALPATTPAERLAKLRRAEALLRAIAGEERDARGWFPLIGNALLNVGGSWLSWATTKGTSGTGWFELLSGFAAGNLQVLTTPTGAMRAWDAYTRAGATGTPRLSPAPSVGWSVAPGVNGGAGASVRVWF